MTPKQFSDLFDEKYHETVFQAYPDSKESHAILLNDIKRFFIEQIIAVLKDQEKAAKKQHKFWKKHSAGNYQEGALQVASDWEAFVQGTAFVWKYTEQSLNNNGK